MERRVQGWLLLFSMEREVRRGSPMESSLLSFSFVLPIVAYLCSAVLSLDPGCVTCYWPLMCQ
jgi:hypothetical protein